MDRAHDPTMLGWCPNCGSRVRSGQSYLSYEPADGWPRMLVECGDCGDVVVPE